MKIEISNNGYNVINSGMVIMHNAESELKFNIKASDGFSFNLVLKFIKDEKKEQRLIKDVVDDKIIFTCKNFESSLGIGTTQPLSIATVEGKELVFHFWSYSMGDGNTRKVEYTFLKEI